MNRREDMMAAGAGGVFAAPGASGDTLSWGILFRLSHNMLENRPALGRESRFFRSNLQYQRDCALNTLDRSRPQDFLQAPWRKTRREYREHRLAAIEQVGAARKRVAGQAGGAAR